MRKIKIRLPAFFTGMGAGLHSIHLALSLYTTVEISARDDTELIVETEGEGAGDYPLALQHPVVLAMMRIFQRLEKAPAGFYVRVENNIPLQSGLGAEAVFMTAGVIGANNLMNNVFSRDESFDILAQILGREDALASVLGGLVSATRTEQGLIHRSLPLTPFKLIIALPELATYQRPHYPERVLVQDALHDHKRLPLMLEALRAGDLPFLMQVLSDRLYTPHVTSAITGYQHVTNIAKLAGALGAIPCGGGPAIAFFAETQHNRIAEAIEAAFDNLNITARTWVIPVDTQGIVLSVAQSQ